jgi:hypothetical protein
VIGLPTQYIRVVTHFEIWTASQISAVIDQSHRIWQRNGSAAHAARFVKPPVRAGSIARLPLRKQAARPLLDVLAVFAAK